MKSELEKKHLLVFITQLISPFAENWNLNTSLSNINLIDHEMWINFGLINMESLGIPTANS